MASSRRLPDKTAARSNAGPKFQFISIQHPEDAKDRTVRRLARSHAVARGIKNKLKLQQLSGQNFRPCLEKDVNNHQPAKKANQRQFFTTSPTPLPTDVSDAFDLLTGDLPKLQQQFTSQDDAQLKEPVFSVADELVLQNFRSVIKEGQDDPALLNAVLLTLTFSITAGTMTRKCLEYQGEALSSVRRKMSSHSPVASESTLGAILLLAGIAARREMPRQVQLHMGAIQQLVDTCQREGVFLSDGIKRAIFWQDLNSAIMTGSSRVFDHTTFSELRWRRDPHASYSSTLPTGFRTLAHSLGHEFVEVLEDIHALQCIRDTDLFVKEDAMSMANIDNHQASIQSRLLNLPARSSISDCCFLGAYLCSTMLRCKLWRASTIPPFLSLKLLYKLQDTKDDPVWDQHPEMLAWLLHIGGAFAPVGELRTGYVELLHMNRNTRLRGLYSSWPELLLVMMQFIWSDKAFMSQVQTFYQLDLFIA